MSMTLTMDFQYKTTIGKLWTALTDAEQLAKWVLPNDFRPIVGYRFQFRNEPNEYWDGLVDGEVLVVEPPHRLSYTWGTGDERHTVTWTLEERGDGIVNLHLEQTGISGAQALGGAKYGWTANCAKLDKVLAE